MKLVDLSVKGMTRRGQLLSQSRDLERSVLNRQFNGWEISSSQESGLGHVYAVKPRVSGLYCLAGILE